MMEGIDGSFDAAILLGYHTGAHNPAGVRAHTLSSACIHSLAINGSRVCEAELSAFIAGHFGVPVVMISGDDALMEEVRSALPRTEKVVTKRAIAYHSAETWSPADVLPLLRDGARRGVGLRDEIEPTAINGPATVSITFKNHRPAELLGYLAGVERTDAHSIEHQAGDILEASRFLEFVLGYRADLTP